MSEISDLVVKKYDGSLKAEHGTGRNMAPFVELEWGKEAYKLMQDIKKIFDPLNILNPGVILNPDKDAHIKNLKPLPAANEIIDKCTECGFCEPSCVSADMTLTPRQRIVIHRELMSLAKSGNEPHIAASLAKSFEYDGNETCETDGLCALNCPVKIDTGQLIKSLRSEYAKNYLKRSLWIAGHMKQVTATGRIALSIVSFIHSIIGTAAMKNISLVLRKISANPIPAWNQYMPSGSKRIKIENGSPFPRKVVYFPSCINRSMGVSREYRNEKQLSEKIVQLLHKGGYEVIFPGNMNNLCCGMAFLSKGYIEVREKNHENLKQP
jgi:D-lactate dehydrogenase